MSNCKICNGMQMIKRPIEPRHVVASAPPQFSNLTSTIEWVWAWCPCVFDKIVK
jgi:hypothetical protein